MNKLFKRALSVTTALAVGLSGMYIVGRDNVDDVKADEYKLVWQDEFEGTTLNKDIWNIEVNGNGGGNQEKQYYVDNKDNISVGNGSLKITARKQQYQGKAYTSGRINTKNKVEVKFGKVEARMKIPSFTGAWPAFWMLGSSYDRVGWPSCGEIDIMEAINAENFVYGTVHWKYKNTNADHGKSSQTAGITFDRTGWHTYTLEWDDTSLRWYIDGQLYHTQGYSDDGEMQELKEKHFIIFNLAIGGVWPQSVAGNVVDESKLPATMEVDYVKVYQKDSDNGSLTGLGLSADQIRPGNQSTANGTNLAKGMKAYASNSEKAELDISMAVDGNDNSRWSSGFSDDEWMYVDLGKVYNIDRVVIDWEDAYARAYKIQTSLDGVEWTTVADLTGRTGGKETITFAATNAQYVKMQGVNRSTVYGYSMWEFGVYSTEIDGAIPTTTKVAPTTKEVSTTTKVIPTTKEVSTTTKTIETTTISKSTTANKNATVKKPTKVRIVKVKKITSKTAKRSVKVTLKKQKKVVGYQIKCSTNSKFKTSKTKKYYTKKTYKTIKNLKVKTKYYIKARAYVKDTKGKKLYGIWSKVKKVKI